MLRLDWRRIAIYIGVLLALAIPASASPPTFCCTATSGQTITAANWNNSFSPLYSALNGGIDSTFISTAGIGANQIKSGCTGCTGIFGFPATFNPASAGSVPVTLTNAGSPSAHYFDVTANGGTAGALFNIDSIGFANINFGNAGLFNLVVPPSLSTTSTTNAVSGAATVITVGSTVGLVNGEQIKVDSGGNSEWIDVASFTSSTITPATNWAINHTQPYAVVASGIVPAKVQVLNDSGATNGAQVDIPAGSTNGFVVARPTPASTTGPQQTLMQVSASGDLQVCPPSSVGSLNACGRVPPVYKNDGTVSANTLHVVGPVNVTTQLSSNCASLAVCSVNVTTFSLTSAAGYTSNTTYGCFATDESGQVVWNFSIYASGLVTFAVRNITGATITGTPFFNTVVMCIGT